MTKIEDGLLTKYGIAILRCSSKPQLDKYGPASQLQTVKESLQFFSQGPLELVDTIQVQESASGWNRKKWEAAVDQCLDAYKQGKAQVLIFPRVDRQTRFLAGSFEKLLQVIRSGMMVYFAREHLWLDSDNPDAWEQYQREALEAQAYVRVLRKNTTEGKERCAEAGSIPSGFGRYNGYMGLAWNSESKRFDRVDGMVQVAHEILTRCLNGEHSSRIVIDLQRRGIRGIGGGILHRSAVNRVLAHAAVYAGTITWNGTTIRGKVEPIITEAQAACVADRLRINQENSHGFGKRKWLTGRVFCQLCGRRYNLDSRKMCRCNGADHRTLNPCVSPKISLRELSTTACDAMYSALTKRETILERVQKTHDDWEHEQHLRDELKREQQQRNDARDKRRRSLSFQHEVGGLTDPEYMARLNQLQKEADDTPQFNQFLTVPEPITVEETLELVCDGRFDTMVEMRRLSKRVLDDPQDREATELAERIGLKIIVGAPKVEGKKYSAQVLMNLPLAPTANTDMVCQTS